MKIEKLADYDHPVVIQKANELSKNSKSLHETLKKIFLYVRDEIRFEFPVNGDLIKASETIVMQKGQCNTKGTLFLALCRALGIPARMHFSGIRKEIQRGLFTGISYKLMPDTISHGWIEVEINNVWRRLDSYINDLPFYLNGKEELKKNGWDTGYSISCSSGESSADFNIEDEHFVQMDAVVEDHGVWDEPSDYFNSNMYRNRPNAFKLFVYRMVVGKINQKVETIRKKERCILCAVEKSAGILNQPV